MNQATQDTLLHQAALNDLEEEAIFLVKAKAKTGSFNRQVRRSFISTSWSQITNQARMWVVALVAAYQTYFG